MSVESFIASRLRFKGKLAVVAIAVSFFVIIISLAISGGFRNEIRRGLSSLSGDVQLVGSSEPVSCKLPYLPRLSALDGVASITPVIWKPGIVKGPDDISGVLVKGVPMPDSCSLQARIPVRLARKLKLAQGDRFTAWFVEDKLRARNFTVSEIFESLVDTDEGLTIIVPLADLQRLSGWSSSECSSFEVMLKDGAEPDAVAFAMSLIAYDGSQEGDEDIIRATTAREKYPQLFDWLNLIDVNVTAIILLMIVVAGFNMISGLLILLFRHISTIGMLKSMGMGNRAIAKVFLRVAARSTALGMLAGNAAALLFCLIQGTTHLIKLNPANYFVSFVPVSVSPAAILLVDVLSMAAIMLFLLIPTLFISRVDPASTVRVK